MSIMRYLPTSTGAGFLNHQQYQSGWLVGFIPFLLARSFTSNLTKDLRNPGWGKQPNQKKPHGLVGLKPTHCSATFETSQEFAPFFGGAAGCSRLGGANPALKNTPPGMECHIWPCCIFRDFCGGQALHSEKVMKTANT